MKITIPVALMICAALIAGCKKKADEASEPTAQVQAEHPTSGPISEEIAADAVLSPLAQAAIEPRISAPIEKELVQRGSRVHKGDLLVQLEDRDLRGAAMDSQGGLAQAQAAYSAATLATIPEDEQKAELDVAQAKANLDVANRTAEERNRLLDQGAIARRDVETAQGRGSAGASGLRLCVETSRQRAEDDAANQHGCRPGPAHVRQGQGRERRCASELYSAAQPD